VAEPADYSTAQRLSVCRLTSGLYLVLIVLHVAHIFEEAWGHFFMIEILNSLGWFLIINWIIIACVALIFFFYLQGKRWSIYAGIVYASAMWINGLVHLAATAFTGRYLHGFAGAVSGCGLLVVAPFLVRSLLKELRLMRTDAEA
jgi:hypothetical protein